MNKVIKRVLSVVLCALIIVSIAAPGFTASAVSSNVPIIYIKGRSTPIYDKNEKKIYPMSPTLSEVIDKNMGKIVTSAMTSYTTNNWDILGDTLYNLIAPLYKEQVLSKDGTITNGSHIKPIPAPTVDKDGSYALYQYIFEYDSRIDPWEIAASLKTYVNNVLKATGAKKVSIVSRCMGSTILAAYLTRYKNDDQIKKIDTAIFYAAASNGVLINSAPFAGKIEFDADELKKYLDKNNNNNSDDEFEGLLNGFGKVFNGLSANLGAKVANDLFQKAGPKILPRLLLATYGTMPAYWAMVSDDDFEDAKAYVFGKSGSAKRNEYKGLISKIDYYHKNVMLKLKDTLKTLKKNGMKINIVSKYNIDFDPIYEGSNQQGDGWIETKRMSFGATVAAKGKTLASDYLKTAANSGYANYISGDKIIDASTGVFPDYTFYIKNLQHTSWPTSVDELLYAICNSSSQFTVKTNKKYSQFMTYKSNTLTVMSNYKEILNPTVKTITLSKTVYDYDGKAKKPTVEVKDTKGKKLTEGTDYTVSYPSGRTKIGKYTVTVKFKGLYKDISDKKATFQILPAAPKIKASVSGTTLTLSWGAVKGATAYRVYSYDPTTKIYKKLAETKNKSYTIKNLGYGKTYRYSVRSLATVSGTNYYSDFPLVTINMKPAKPVLTVSSGVKAAKLTWKTVAGAKGYEIYRANSKDGTYKKIKTIKDGSVTSYTNSGLFKGKSYYYKIRAYRIIDDKNLYGAYSTVQTAKIK